MFILEYMLFLGVLYIVLWVLGSIFAIAVSLLLALLKFSKGTYISKAFSVYVFASLTALLTLAFIEANPGTASPVILPLIGAFIVFTTLGQDAYEKKKQAGMEYDYELLEQLKYDGFFIFGGLILFIIILFVPIIATNPITEWLFGITEFAYNIKILGWILRIGGVLFLIAEILQGILFLLILVGVLVSKIKGEPKQEPKEELSDEI